MSSKAHLGFLFHIYFSKMRRRKLIRNRKSPRKIDPREILNLFRELIDFIKWHPPKDAFAHFLMRLRLTTDGFNPEQTATWKYYFSPLLHYLYNKSTPSMQQYVIRFLPLIDITFEQVKSSKRDLTYVSILRSKGTSFQKIENLSSVLRGRRQGVKRRFLYWRYYTEGGHPRPRPELDQLPFFGGGKDVGEKKKEELTAEDIIRKLEEDMADLGKTPPLEFMSTMRREEPFREDVRPPVRSGLPKFKRPPKKRTKTTKDKLVKDIAALLPLEDIANLPALLSLEEHPIIIRREDSFKEEAVLPPSVRSGLPIIKRPFVLSRKLHKNYVNRLIGLIVNVMVYGEEDDMPILSDDPNDFESLHLFEKVSGKLAALDVGLKIGMMVNERKAYVGRIKTLADLVKTTIQDYEDASQQKPTDVELRHLEKLKDEIQLSLKKIYGPSFAALIVGRLKSSGSLPILDKPSPDVAGLIGKLKASFRKFREIFDGLKERPNKQHLRVRFGTEKAIFHNLDRLGSVLSESEIGASTVLDLRANIVRFREMIETIIKPPPQKEEEEEDPFSGLDEGKEEDDFSGLNIREATGKIMSLMNGLQQNIHPKAQDRRIIEILKSGGVPGRDTEARLVKWSDRLDNLSNIATKHEKRVEDSNISTRLKAQIRGRMKKVRKYSLGEFLRLEDLLGEGLAEEEEEVTLENILDMSSEFTEEMEQLKKIIGKESREELFKISLRRVGEEGRRRTKKLLDKWMIRLNALQRLATGHVRLIKDHSSLDDDLKTTLITEMQIIHSFTRDKLKRLLDVILSVRREASKPVGEFANDEIRLFSERTTGKLDDEFTSDTQKRTRRPTTNLKGIGEEGEEDSFSSFEEEEVFDDFSGLNIRQATNKILSLKNGLQQDIHPKAQDKRIIEELESGGVPGQDAKDRLDKWNVRLDTLTFIATKHEKRVKDSNISTRLKAQIRKIMERVRKYSTGEFNRLETILNEGLDKRELIEIMKELTSNRILLLSEKIGIVMENLKGDIIRVERDSGRRGSFDLIPRLESLRKSARNHAERIRYFKPFQLWLHRSKQMEKMDIVIVYVNEEVKRLEKRKTSPSFTTDTQKGTGRPTTNLKGNGGMDDWEEEIEDEY